MDTGEGEITFACDIVLFRHGNMKNGIKTGPVHAGPEKCSGNSLFRCGMIPQGFHNFLFIIGSQDYSTEDAEDNSCNGYDAQAGF